METSGQTFTLYNLLCLIIAIATLAIPYIPGLIKRIEKKLNKHKHFVNTTFKQQSEILDLVDDTIQRSEKTSFNEGASLFAKCKRDVDVIYLDLIEAFKTEISCSPQLDSYKTLSLDFLKYIKCALEDHNCFCVSDFKSNSIYDIWKNAHIIPDYKLKKTLLQIKNEVTNYHRNRIYKKWKDLNALVKQRNS